MNTGVIPLASKVYAAAMAPLQSRLRKWQEVIAQRHGRNRAMVTHFRYMLAYRIGFCRGFERINWPHVERLVFVCMGNICRSPYAEAVATGRRMSAVSAGLKPQVGACANPDAIRNADQRGVDLSGHIAKHIDDLNIGPGDLLVAMEPWQAQRLRRIDRVRSSMAQITLLGIWDSPGNPYIADPFGCGDAYFQTCYSRIDSSIARILRQIGK